MSQKTWDDCTSDELKILADQLFFSTPLFGDAHVVLISLHQSFWIIQHANTRGRDPRKKEKKREEYITKY